MDANALASLLPEPPSDADLDATLDGRSVFWLARQPARGMPAPADFVRLLERHAMEQPGT
jgi:hypothetical protein